MRYFVLLAVLAIGLAQAAPTSDVWELYKTAYQMTYENDIEELLRKEIFLSNVQMIEEHNKKFEAGEETYGMGVNQFSDLTESEFKAQLGFKIFEGNQSGASGVFVADAGVELPSEVDWRKEGVVTPVGNEAGCSCCWAFAVTGAVEGAHAIKTGNLVSLSNQQLVDCSKGNNGCYGGNNGVAYEYIIEIGGLESEFDYPYTSGITHKGGACQFSKSKVKATISSFNRVKSEDENALKQAVATVGPISVAVDADSWRNYRTGVFYDPNCTSRGIDHAVLVIGYGTENGQDYWLVKNDWGSGWGEEGYIKIARNRNNTCGIATMTSYPVV